METDGQDGNSAQASAQSNSGRLDSVKTPRYKSSAGSKRRPKGLSAGAQCYVRTSYSYFVRAPRCRWDRGQGFSS